MSALVKPVRDPAIAGDFAKKFFGQWGMARVRRVRLKRGSRHYDVYEVGVADTSQGLFVCKGESAWDFAEAFVRAGHYLDSRDPIFLRAATRECSQQMEPKPQQVEVCF